MSLQLTYPQISSNRLRILSAANAVYKWLSWQTFVLHCQLQLAAPPNIVVVFCIIIITIEEMKNKFAIQKISKAKLVLTRQQKSLPLCSHLTAEKKPIFPFRDQQPQKTKQIPQNHTTQHNQNQSLVSSLPRQETRQISAIVQRKSLQKIDEIWQREGSIRPRASSETRSDKISSRLKRNFAMKRHTPGCPELIGIVEEIVNVLTGIGMIQSRSSGTLANSKSKFEEIFICLIDSICRNCIITQQDQKENLLPCIQPPFPSLQPLFQKLKTFLKASELKAKSQRLALESNIYRRSMSCEEYFRQVQYLSNDLSKLKEQHQQLQERNRGRLAELQQLSQFCKEKQEQVKQLMKKSLELEAAIAVFEAKSSSLQLCLAQQEEMLKQVNIKAGKMLTFVEQQQEKKILHYVSEAYKDIEGQIYDYALYLQTNAMASSLTWEPKPFRAVEQWVYQEMERVNKFVMSPAESNEDKAARMKTFISNTTRKFRTKEEEMSKITDFKTQCIKKFVKMMQKWLENWQLKQEYLVGLRQEFVVESEEINCLLEKLLEKLRAESIGLVFKEIPEMVDKIKVLWSKIELNYKYGNSFY